MFCGLPQQKLRGDDAMIKAALANSNGASLIALRVSLLSGRFCNQVFDMDVHHVEGVLVECAALLGS